MKIDLQTILVIITFLGAVIFMINKFFLKLIGVKKSNKKNGCSDDCGCN